MIPHCISIFFEKKKVENENFIFLLRSKELVLKRSKIGSMVWKQVKSKDQTFLRQSYECFFKGPRSEHNSYRYTFYYEWVSPFCHRIIKTLEMNELDNSEEVSTKKIVGTGHFAVRDP